MIRRSLEAHGGARVAAGRLAALERRVELFGFHLAKLDVRLHADEVRAPTERTREVFAAVAARAAAARAARARHGDRLGDDARPTTCSRVLDLTDEPVSIVPLLETIADLDGRAGRPAHAARGRALRGPRRRARRPRRGDGRLLRLRQGRRLPRRAVGDLPRAGGAGRGRARGRRRADDLPRPRRQRRPRRRADARGDPRPGAERAARPAQGDRAGRDDLVQVRPAGDGVPQPRVGARRDGAERVPGHRRAARPSPDERALLDELAAQLGGAVPRARLADAELRRLLPRVHAGRRAGAARPRLAPGAAARQRRLPRLAARDPVGLRLDAEPHAAPGLVRLRHRVRRAPTSSGCAASTASCRSSARSSTTSR